MGAQANGANAYGSECGTADAWAGVCSASTLADLATDRLFVIDGRLQVVRANKAFLDAFGLSGPEALAGQTLGSVTACRHAGNGQGCGAAAACAECGWLQAVEACGRSGRGEQECRILQEGGRAFDFAVTVAPAGSGELRVCGLKDLFAAKRLRVLERAFFHDVTNLSAGIRGLCEIEQGSDSGQADELRLLIHDGADKLVEEVERLRALRVAENGDLRVFLSPVAPGEILQRVADRFKEDSSARHLEVVIDDAGAPSAFETDRDLLPSLLGEFARNAIEASKRGDRVTLACRAEGGQIVFSVHNPAELDGNARAHVFERSFSTKGPGHGVGAYRTKLIAERCLNGRVGFVSGGHEGTTFYLRFPLAGAAAPA